MKAKRQARIIEIINKFEIETQKELADNLKDAGFNVTQATISRDIRELKITKISSKSGRQKYTSMGKNNTHISDRLIRIFKDGIASIDFSKNIIVIKTLNGMAMAVAAALDSMNNPEILGSIAGDDTIFCVVKDENNVYNIIAKLKTIIKSD